MQDDVPDIDDVSASAAFTAPPSEPAPRLPPLPDVRVGDVTLRAERPYVEAHGCDDEGKVPFAAGFWSGSDEFDWCSLCFVVRREEPDFAPKPDEQVRLARAGIGIGGHPLQVGVTCDADVDRLAGLAGDHHLPRVILGPSPVLTAVLERRDLPAPLAVHAVPNGMSHCERADVRSFELQLQGLSFGPPIDPDLERRIEAARDEHGHVHDEALANEYFAAMQRQSEALDRLRGVDDSEHVAPPDGKVFPGADGEPLQ